MDILVITDNNLDTVGGEQESTKIILDGLKDEYKFGIIQPGEAQRKIDSVKRINLGSKKRLKHVFKNPISFFKYINNVRNSILFEQPKIVHTQAQLSFFIVIFLRILGQIDRDTKLVHTERGLYTKYGKITRFIFLNFMRKLDVLVTTTEFNKHHWKNANDKMSNKITYKMIPNTAGSIFENFDRTKIKPDKQFTIGFSGRYTEWKNWPLAIEIIHQLDKKIPNQFDIKFAVGCLDEKALKDTEEMFKKLHLDFPQRFSGKINISLDEMSDFYYDLDVFILTSKKNTESFGRTLVEAMSRGTAVLTTDAGGAVEVAGNENYVGNTANDFVRKIETLISNPEILEKQKENNLIRVKHNYSLENNISLHRQLYNELLNLNTM